LTARLAHIFNVPIVLVGMIGENRESFVSHFGLAEDLAKEGIARSDSVCSQVVASGQALIIEDLARDRRFSRNVFLRERKFRFYAGVPLNTADGYTIGSLCVLDYKPRKFSEQEMRLLQVQRRGSHGRAQCANDQALGERCVSRCRGIRRTCFVIPHSKFRIPHS
jgi:GAF domain-containing protein